MEQHPMVEAYLAELDRALIGCDSREHAETVSAVREHLADAVPLDASREQVQRTLDELGPVEAIAAAATTGAVPCTAPENAAGVTSFFTIGILATAIVGAVLLVPVPFLAVPLTIVALVMGIVRVRTARRDKYLAWAAVVIASVTLVAALVLAMTLLAARMESTATTPQQSVPLQTAPSAPDDSRG